MDCTERTIFVPYIHAFGGVERLLLGLSKFLHRHGCAHSIVCFNQTIDLAAHANWPLRVLQLGPRRNPVSEITALFRFLRKAATSGSAPALIFDLNGSLYAGFARGADYVLHLTDPPSLLPADVSKYALSLRSNGIGGNQSVGWARSIRSELVHRANSRGVRNAKSVIVMTHRIAQEVEKLYGVSAKVLRPGVPAKLISPRRRLTPGEPVRLLSVSRLEESKRVDWILRALADEQNRHENLVLDLVGDGTQAASLKSLTVELGLTSRVQFHGRVSDERLKQVYETGHVFLMPAVQGYGLPALEALASGMPVILHRESGVAEILSGTPWAEIMDSIPGSLSRAITRMLARMRDDTMIDISPPGYPTEEDWAMAVCRTCGWLPAYE